jgi:hypothetical protein
MPSFGELCSFCSLRAEVERKLRVHPVGHGAPSTR